MNRSNYEYKKSGVLWFGDIPDHWEIKKVKHIARFYTGWTPPSGNDEYYDGEYPWANISDLGTKYLETPVRKITQEAIDTLRMSISKKGSLLFSFKLSIGLVSMLSKDLFTNEAIATFPPNNRIETTYLYYLAPVAIPMNAGINIYNAPMLNQDSIKNAVLVYPPLDEQQAVASFLDRETARIDALIQKKERMIELLKEKRITLITQAVTKGLDPNVPMKDSGIEWLGEVPEHWDIKKLKHVSTYMVSNVDKKTQEGETTIRLFNYTDVYNNEFLTNEMDLMVASAPPGQLDNFIVYTDDVLITKDSEDWKDIAKPALVKSTAPDILCGYHLAMIRPIRGISTGKFLFRALQSTLINQQFQIASNGVTRYGLPKSAIGESLITLPPIKEQHEIASHIDQETSKIDNLTSKIISSITLLREYRSSLINAAVTGKIDLREAL